jgi:hypothetical protein
MWSHDDKLQKFVVQKMRDEFISGKKTIIKVDDRNSIVVPRSTYMTPEESEDYWSADQAGK